MHLLILYGIPDEFLIFSKLINIEGREQAARPITEGEEVEEKKNEKGN